ncbi:hypothetical protein OH807_23460 [Kitasatospora sp. NBC_01560]|uniref:hypothetical protein n=1 Tax=Kitasatospora sp. NBC_01560 TaxID=2975965 RepID=UPI003866C7AB
MSDTATPAGPAPGPDDAPGRPTLGELAAMPADDLGALLRRAGVEDDGPVAKFSSMI